MKASHDICESAMEIQNDAELDEYGLPPLPSSSNHRSAIPSQDYRCKPRHSESTPKYIKDDVELGMSVVNTDSSNHRDLLFHQDLPAFAYDIPKPRRNI
jgi:hypothetical protein